MSVARNFRGSSPSFISLDTENGRQSSLSSRSTLEKSSHHVQSQLLSLEPRRSPARIVMPSSTPSSSQDSSRSSNVKVQKSIHALRSDIGEMKAQSHHRRPSQTPLDRQPPVPPTPKASPSTESRHYLRKQRSTSDAKGQARVREKWNSVARPELTTVAKSDLPTVPPAPPAKSPAKAYHSFHPNSAPAQHLPVRTSSLLCSTEPSPQGSPHFTKPAGLANTPILPRYPLGSSSMSSPTFENRPSQFDISVDDSTTVTAKERPGYAPRAGKMITRRASIMSFTAAPGSLTKRLSDADLRISAQKGHVPFASFDRTAVSASVVFPPERRSSEDSDEETFSYVAAYYNMVDESNAHTAKAGYHKAKAGTNTKVHSHKKKEASWTGRWNREDITVVMNALRELRV